MHGHTLIWISERVWKKNACQNSSQDMTFIPDSMKEYQKRMSKQFTGHDLYTWFNERVSKMHIKTVHRTWPLYLIQWKSIKNACQNSSQDMTFISDSMKEYQKCTSKQLTGHDIYPGQTKLPFSFFMVAQRMLLLWKDVITWLSFQWEVQERDLNPCESERYNPSTPACIDKSSNKDKQTFARCWIFEDCSRQLKTIPTL